MTIDQSAPVVASIVRAGASSLPLGATTADFTVTFSEPVTGVDPSDFTVALGGTVGVAGPIAVAGMNSVYTVTVNGISGSGTLGLNLTDNGSIRDSDGNRITDNFAPVTFSPQTPPATGNVPISVGAGDLNGDGRPDLVVANFFDHNASVLLGNGDGTFQAPTTYNTGVDPNSALAADVNGDAILDLIVLNYFDTNVSVLLGNGNGTFQGQVTYASLANPDSAAAIDVSGDGRPDLVVANRGANSVSVLLGNGDGTFQPQIPYPVGMQPMSLAVNDVNNDGLPDLVAANLADNSVSVLLGNGNGTFLGQMTFPTGASPHSVAVADFNSDGLPDLVVANSGNNSLGVLLGNGNGSFQPQVPWSVGVMPQAVTVADMNADGWMDLIVANSSDDNLGVLLGDGNGNFFSPSTAASGSTPTAVVSLDVNLDGKPDLVAANQFGNTLSVLLGNPVGDFTGESYTVPPSEVVDRHLFYLGSTAFNVTDEDHPGNSDDNAIAPDKSAYLSGAGSAVFANVSSYSRGINGIMVDLLVRARTPRSTPATSSSKSATITRRPVGQRRRCPAPSSFAPGLAPAARIAWRSPGPRAARRRTSGWKCKCWPPPTPGWPRPTSFIGATALPTRERAVRRTTSRPRALIRPRCSPVWQITSRSPTHAISIAAATSIRPTHRLYLPTWAASRN